MAGLVAQQLGGLHVHVGEAKGGAQGGRIHHRVGMVEGRQTLGRQGAGHILTEVERRQGDHVVVIRVAAGDPGLGATEAVRVGVESTDPGDHPRGVVAVEHGRLVEAGLAVGER